VSSIDKAQSKILKLRTRILLATRLNHDGHKLNKVAEMKICSSKGYRTVEDMIFFEFFGGSQYVNSKQSKGHTSTSHGKPKI
jgi:hypothetical protein